MILYKINELLQIGEVVLVIGGMLVMGGVSLFIGLRAMCGHDEYCGFGWGICNVLLGLAIWLVLAQLLLTTYLAVHK